MNQTASGEWFDLEAKRSGKMDKVERLAEITLPSVCTDENYDSGRDDLTNGTTSFGAQAVTNLVNKLMMSMFPQRPFYRLALGEQEAAQLVEKMGITLDNLTDLLAQGERDATLQLEMTGSRDVLYEILNHLTVAGDVMMDLSDEEIVSAIPIREYVVRRDSKGRPLSIVIKQCMYRMELDPKVLPHLPFQGTQMPEDHIHEVYTWIKVFKGKMRMTKWVDNTQLPYDQFGATWEREDCPYRPLTWRLPLRQNYGVSRVEEYYSDLAAYETGSEAMLDGSTLAAQFRWLQNPGGVTRPEDFAASQNGDVIPGVANDLQLVVANIGQQLNSVISISQIYERRIGAGFLMNSAVTRQAERVTAEEIRLQAQELESSLGGVYSRLAREIQQPLARWLMKKIDMSLKGTKITPVVVTGLDALSRNAELERLLMFLQDVTNLSGIDPQQRMMLQESNIIADMAAGRGVSKQRYVASNEEIQQRQAQIQQQAAQQQQGGEPVAPANVPGEQAQ